MRAIAVALAVGARTARPVRLHSRITAAEMSAPIPLPDRELREAALFLLAFATPDRVEGVAAFLEKRPAVFPGR